MLLFNNKPAGGRNGGNNFNTSNVTIQRFLASKTKTVKGDFNTSNVTIQPKIILCLLIKI